MKLCLTFLFLTSAAFARFAPPDRPGPCGVEMTRVEIPARGARYPGLFYQPTLENGTLENQAVVVLGHGFLAGFDRYDSLCTWLAGHGFYVLVPGYPDPGLLRPAGDIRFDLDAAMDFLDSLSRLPGVSMDPHNIALVGHSVGGGAAFSAARLDTLNRVTCVVGLAPHKLSGAVRPESLALPVLVVTGDNDLRSPPGNVRRDFYEPHRGLKQFITIRNGGHNGYLDHTSTFEDLFEKFDRPAQLRTVRRYLTAFLRFHLDGDYRNHPYLFGEFAQGDSTIILEQELRGVGAMNFIIWAYPDTCRSRVYVRSPTRTIDSVQVYRQGGAYVTSLSRDNSPRMLWDCTDFTGTPVPDDRYVLHCFTTKYGYNIPGLSDLEKKPVYVIRR